MVSLETRTSLSEPTSEEVILSLTLKNKSDKELIIPDFHDSTFNAAYFFDLELHSSEGRSTLIKASRPVVPVKSAHAPPQKVKLKAGSEYAYFFPIDTWSVIEKTPPIFRKIAPGSYNARIIWSPTVEVNWFKEAGLTWLKSSNIKLEESTKLTVK